MPLDQTSSKWQRAFLCRLTGGGWRVVDFLPPTMDGYTGEFTDCEVNWNGGQPIVRTDKFEMELPPQAVLPIIQRNN